MSTASPAATAKHRQVFEVVRGRIQSGAYKPGDRIPSEANLIVEFGVSRPTVARALHELERRGLVSRRRGAGTYVSKSEVGGKHFGLLIPGLGKTEIFEPICGEIARLAQQDGHSLLWGATHLPDAAAGSSGDSTDEGAIALEICERFVRDRVGGVFFAPLEILPGQEQVNFRIVELLDAAKIPIVLIDRDYLPYPGRSEHDLVGMNSRRVGYTITAHMFDAGCKRLMFLYRPGSTAATKARSVGFAEAFIVRKLHFEAEFIQECDPEDRPTVEHLLATQKPEGIVCGNDSIAAQLLQTLDACGVKVPADLLIGGVDDLKYAAFLRVPLTTVRQPFAAIGDTAYHTMLDRIERPTAAPRHIMLAGQLVVRESTRRP